MRCHGLPVRASNRSAPNTGGAGGNDYLAGRQLAQIKPAVVGRTNFLAEIADGNRQLGLGHGARLTFLNWRLDNNTLYLVGASH